MVDTAKKTKIVVICGPTGIGKTSISIDIALKFKGEIVSADSMQIYKYMDIGSAKPTPEERQKVPHHLIDILTPDQPFDAADYIRHADSAINFLTQKKIQPFIVGGSGFYIKALLHGLYESKRPDPIIRNQLKEIGKIKGSKYLHEQLYRCDPEKAKTIHPNDLYRIIRALEVYESTGHPISEFHIRHRFQEQRYDPLIIGLDMPRDQLYERINTRVDQMIAAGLLPEVQSLLNMGYSANLKSMQAIGYRHMVDFINGKYSWEETVRILKRDTRHYAKRQLTWFKSVPDIIWIQVNAKDSIEKMLYTIASFLMDDLSECQINTTNSKKNVS